MSFLAYLALHRGIDHPREILLERFWADHEPARALNLAASLAYYRGDLLLGWYDDWVLVERERLRVLCLRGYRRLLEHHAALDEFEPALAAGRAALAMEPLQEAVQQRVIELYAANGQRI